jgi:O-antigen/teichoic acid export membrane protein
VKSLSGYVIGRRPRRPSTFVDASLVAYKSSADVVSKAVTLAVTVAAARALPANDFGVMALAMTTGWILGVASDAGLPMHLATRVAQAHAIARGEGSVVLPIVRAIMRWRWMLGVLAAACGVAIGALLVSADALLPFALIVGHQLFGAMLDTLAHAYRGLGRTDIESSLSLGHRGAVALGALTVLALRPSLLSLSVALVLPPLLALLTSHAIVRRISGFQGSRVPEFQGSGQRTALSGRQFFRDVAPLGLGVLFSALYFRCDVYFIQRLHGVEMVGIYNAAFRVVDALRLFPAAALAVAYPSLCAATDLGPVRRVSFGLLGAALVVTLAIFTGAHPLLALVYGEPYAAGGNALQVLSLCLPLFYVNYALTHQLIAWEGQRAYLAIAAAALVVNLAANAVLIPEGGMVGAAISTVVTEVIVVSGCLFSLRRR